MSTLAPGLRLHDRFLLVGRIGVGGMAEVWRADDTVLGRPVAVKVLDPSIGSDTTIRMATHREARAAAGLTHPNITRVYDYGEAALPGGGLAPYLVMELVEGHDLAERLDAGPLPWAAAAAIAAQVAAGLAAAHAAGVVHCDIKPGNVMLTPGGVKILDFGIAGLAGTPDGGLRYGTVGYCSPERLAGADPTPAGDVYAVGVLLAEALVGQRPESSRGLARFPVVPGVPPALTRIGTACLAADPSQRPTSADLAGVLGDLARSAPHAAAAAPVSPGPARPMSPGRAVVPAPTSLLRSKPSAEPEPAPSGSPRNPMRAVAIGGVAAALVVIAIVVAIVASPGSDGTPGGQVAQAGASPGVVADPTTDPPTPTPTAPTDQAGALAAFEALLAQAVDDGKIDEKAAERISNRLDDLRDAVAEGEDVEREARDLRGELLRDRNREHVDEEIRLQLARLLIPFNANGDSDTSGDNSGPGRG
ncbi:serine/threonine-protein kinase [Asanoa iriomotensis]|uniref:non-specific serine/threonine protein kinase n=1 Tax=Asanoa iriomotensis TaxID=234613 RepID=A0ABQ4C7D2_9ACTN|nr:serine/threonine-protein kinase [Asanoa iriomotensis]GIF58687.1 putative serine/threonine-protein kinase PknA [Asanoa iriomotensis]